MVNFWRGLRGVGRWGHADPSLLEGLDVDLFEYADSQFQQAYNYLNFYVAIEKPDPMITGISVIPMDILEAKAPDDFHKISR